MMKNMQISGGAFGAAMLGENHPSKKNTVGKKRLPTNKNTRFLLPTLVVLLCEQCHQSGIAASMEQKLVNWLDRPADLLWCSAL